MSRSEAAVAPLSRDQLMRYSRHLLLPEVGLDGQRKIARARVLLVGAGGLGSPAALYLAAAGVGEIGLIDADRVSASNLQRQVLYSTDEIGTEKVDAARHRVEGLNPEVRVTAHPGRLTSANAFEILRPYDIVLDGSDNFPTRYLVNDACVLLGKPDVYGSVYRFEGQATVFDSRRGPCYRCLYPEPPPPDLVPSCSDAGVLGVVPGLIGLLQATEALKLILGQGEPLVGRLLLVDTLGTEFREVRVRKNPECPICSEHPTQTALIDYEQFCGVDARDEGAGLPMVSPQELATELRSTDPPVVIDVRESVEWEVSHLPGARLIPRPEIGARVEELTSARRVVLYCRHGQRSSQAARLLLELGFRDVRVLDGGIERWAREVDPAIELS